MSFFFLILLASLFGFAFLLIRTSRQHKRHSPNTTLLHSTAIVDKQLSPDGTVLVRGELWPARSNDISFIRSGAIVKVVGLTGQTLLIEEQPPQSQSPRFSRKRSWLAQ